MAKKKGQLHYKNVISKGGIRDQICVHYFQSVMFFAILATLLTI
jgi:hypothetical protein